MDDLLRDGEAEAVAAHLARARLVDAVEAVEDLRLVLFGDADARVADGKAHPALLRALVAHGDAAAVRRVLDGVVDEDQHELADLLLVGLDLNLRQVIRLQVDLLLLGERLHEARRLLDERREIELLRLELQRLVVAARDDEQVADELRHLLDLVAHIVDDLPQERRLDRRVVLQELRRGHDDGERRPELMRGVRRKLALLLVGLPQRDHRLAREDVADDRRDDQRDGAEEGQRVRRLLHAVVHRRDILADVDRLRRMALIVADLLGRQHDAGLARVLRAGLREDRHAARLHLLLRDRVEDEGLDAERGAREVQEAPLVVEDIEEQAVIRALVGDRIVEHDLRVLVEVLLRLRHIARRVHELARLLRRDRPLHRLVHREDQHDEEDDHDDRVEQRELAAAAAKDVLRHQLLASSL